MKKILLVLSFLAISQSAYCLSISSTAVGLAGVENNGSQVYINPLSNPNNCLYSGVYFTNAAEISRVLAVALAAKAAGKTVRIDYNQPGGSGTLCTGYAIYQN